MKTYLSRNQTFYLKNISSALFSVFCCCLGCFAVSAQNSTLTNRNSWYTNSVIYTLDVEVFQDSDGDGTGDFKGLRSRLNYLDSLGIDAIWLAPFQPTPNLDDGYDVSDFYGIDPRLGTQEDFTRFIEEARKKDIRVLIDLVINHTSNQHPWFQAARKDPTSPYNTWYVWSEKKPANQKKGMVFPGVQKEIWTYDSLARAYYLHRFYRFQPDLNAQNPEVKKEVDKIIAHWLKQGVAGFRLDAVPFYIEVPQTRGKNFEHQFEELTQLRNEVEKHRTDGVILGEANVLPKESKQYFGEKGDGMHMMFNFYVNQHLFYALATGKVKPLAKALEATKDIPPQAQWAQFLRNHDEVDLGRLSNKERNQVYEQFGPEKHMQLYDRGIRRRLAPMLHNRKQLELAYSLLFSLPSTPVIRYGDEIGMGDDLSLKERESVRTPMQWSGEKNGGFSSADSTVRPVIRTGEYGYPLRNVTTQRQDSSSLLTWTARMIKLRKQCPEIGNNTWQLLKTNASQAMAIRYEGGENDLVVIHNFSPEPLQIDLASKDIQSTTLHNLFTGKDESVKADRTFMIQMEGYGYRWYRTGNKSSTSTNERFGE